jgi:hypothetical protein
VKMAVSSAKVLRIVLSDWGRSAVYNMYRNGPSMLPWGTPEMFKMQTVIYRIVA